MFYWTPNGLSLMAASDIFSIGVILWQMINGIGNNNTPFTEASKNDSKYKDIINGNFNSFWKYHKKIPMMKWIDGKILDNLKYLFQGLFEFHVKKRFDIKSIETKSEWYKQITPAKHKDIQFYFQNMMYQVQSAESKKKAHEVCTYT